MVWLTAEGGGDDEKDDMMRRQNARALVPSQINSLALITEPPD